MALTLLNKKALEQISEQNLRLCDQNELKAIMEKVSLVKSAGNNGYERGNSRARRFRGDIPFDIHRTLMFGVPNWDRAEKDRRKAAFFRAFPKFAVQAKSKYV